ncbi:MAG: exosortase/archaeosortase family protein, partial [Chitinophagaceae bacterium]
LAMPASWKRKVIFAFTGAIIIHFVNLIRCVGLCALAINASVHFDFAHHYLFKIMVYSTIFLLWVQFMRKVSLKKA